MKQLGDQDAVTVIMDEAELCFPQLNASCGRTTRPRSRLSSGLLSLVTVLTVVLNLLVVVSISHFRQSVFVNLCIQCFCTQTNRLLFAGSACVQSLISGFRQLHTTTNLLVFSLAVTDFLVGFLQMPSVLVLYQSCWILGDFVCDVNFFLGGFLVSVSVGNMVLISVDRYVAVCEPMFYSTKVTVKRVQLCICLCWMFSVVHSSWILRDFFKQQDRYDFCSGACAAEFKLNEVAFDTAVTFFGPITVIVLLYVRIFAVAVSQARAMRSHVAAFTAKRSETVRPKKSELKAARTLGVVIVVFILCYSPFCVVIAGIMNNSTWAFDATIQYWLVYSNSCLNPLIYAFVYPWFRKSIKLIVTLQILQPNSSEANVL